MLGPSVHAVASQQGGTGGQPGGNDLSRGKDQGPAGIPEHEPYSPFLNQSHRSGWLRIGPFSIRVDSRHSRATELVGLCHQSGREFSASGPTGVRRACPGSPLLRRNLIWAQCLPDLAASSLNPPGSPPLSVVGVTAFGGGILVAGVASRTSVTKPYQ